MRRKNCIVSCLSFEFDHNDIKTSDSILIGDIISNSYILGIRIKTFLGWQNIRFAIGKEYDKECLWPYDKQHVFRDTELQKIPSAYNYEYRFPGEDLSSDKLRYIGRKIAINLYPEFDSLPTQGHTHIIIEYIG